MKKEKSKKVRVGNQFVEVTPSTPEVYKITLVYSGGIPIEEFYRSFRDEDDAYRYCIEMADKKMCINCFFEYSVLGTWLAKEGGNKDEE